MTGQAVRFKPMSANRQMAVGGAYPALLPQLLRRGLSLEDASALAYNTAFLFYALDFDPPFASPAALLDVWSIGEIAGLCEEFTRRQEEEEAADPPAGQEGDMPDKEDREVAPWA